MSAIEPEEHDEILPDVALSWRVTLPLVGAAAAMQLGVWWLLWLLFGVVGVGYNFFDVSDLSGTYYPYALKIAHGLAPFRDFFVEYPPLFLPLLFAVGYPTTEWAFMTRFAMLMGLFMIGAAIVTSLAGATGGSASRPYKTAVVFSACTLALGPVTVNRYDAVVAFVLALALLFMMRGSWGSAGVAIGIGFALKVTPVMLIPLVFMLAPARRELRAFAGFAIAGAAPFIPVLALGGQSYAALRDMLGYHLSRPLEIESVLATPLWIAKMLGAITIQIELSAGSQAIHSATADTIARLSALVLLAALAATFVLVWRRRETIASDHRLIALAVLATMLGSFVGSKVLSPQYFVWALPAIALVAVDRKALGWLMGAVLLLTHVEFPGNYWAFAQHQLPWPTAVVIARNLLLVVAFGLSLWHLWRLPEEIEPTS